MAQSIPPVSLDPVSGSTYDAHVSLRVQFVVAQLMNTHAGAPAPEVAQALGQRLRGVGVNISSRDVQQIAESIAHLPRAA